MRAGHPMALVAAAGVVMGDVLIQDHAQVPFAGDERASLAKATRLLADVTDDYGYRVGAPWPEPG